MWVSPVWVARVSCQGMGNLHTHICLESGYGLAWWGSLWHKLKIACTVNDFHQIGSIPSQSTGIPHLETSITSFSDSSVSQRFFPKQWAARMTSIRSYVITVNIWFYSNVSWILILHKKQGCHNKFDSTKSLRIYYRYFKIPQCRLYRAWIKRFFMVNKNFQWGSNIHLWSSCFE